jgi:uncharacterized protein (TIGR02217 family)
MTLNPFTETRLNLFKTNWQIDTAFDTLALEDGAGREQRLCKITESLTSINADGMLLNADEFNYLKAFFDARNGKYEGFRFKNELDYTLTQSPEYYSSDTTVYQQGILVQKSGLTYQIMKRYHVNGTNTYKTIKKPVNGTVKVYSNGVELTSGWSVNINTGIVTFSSSPSGTLTVSCEYDLPMRFDMDEDQLNHKVVENDSSFHSANDVYQVLQFALIEDSYDKFNNYVASDFDDIDYDFIPDPLPEITKGTFTVTRIKTTQSKKEKRAIQSTGKATRKLGQNGLLDKELKAIYTLFMVAKGRKCAFNYNGQSYRFDSDIFKCSYRSFGWDFAGIDLKQSIVHEVPKVNTLCHCIKIKIKNLERSYYYAPQFLKVFFDSNINANPHPDTYGYSGPYDIPFTVDGFWTYTAFQAYWAGPIINGIQVEGGIFPDTDPFRAWYQTFPVSIYSRGDYSRVILAPDANPITIQLPNTNLSSIEQVKDKETGFVYTLGTHYTQSLIYGQVTPIAGTAIADSTGLEIRYRV